MIHHRQGDITQIDKYSWDQYRQADINLPAEMPLLPLNTRLFTGRCTQDQMDTTPAGPEPIQTALPAPPTIAVRRIDGNDSTSNQANRDSTPAASTHSQATSRVEELPIVSVEQTVSIQRQLDRRRRDYKDLRRMAETARDDVIRLEGILAKRQ